jgi:hypothetical protein
MSIENVLDKIFSEPPKAPCTYNLNLSNDNSGTMFQLLLGVLIYGAKKIYGDDITPSQITLEQFDVLKSYIESIGYVIKHNYTDLTQNEIISSPKLNAPSVINIWFEQYIPKIDCHGKTLY